MTNVGEGSESEVETRIIHTKITELKLINRLKTVRYGAIGIRPDAEEDEVINMASLLSIDRYKFHVPFRLSRAEPEPNKQGGGRTRGITRSKPTTEFRLSVSVVTKLERYRVNSEFNLNRSVR